LFSVYFKKLILNLLFVFVCRDVTIAIPMGREIESGEVGCELDHNEYIVYDISQAKQRYLVRLNITKSQ
jgi:hypothetical protein